MITLLHNYNKVHWSDVKHYVLKANTNTLQNLTISSVTLYLLKHKSLGVGSEDFICYSCKFGIIKSKSFKHKFQVIDQFHTKTDWEQSYMFQIYTNIYCTIF